MADLDKFNYNRGGMKPTTVEPTSEFFVEANRGHLPGKRLIHKFGFNGNVSTTEQDVWIPGGTLIHQTADTTYEVLSSDGNDTIAGTGARTVVLIGLDSGFNEITETINMDGINPVVSDKSYIRLTRAYNYDVGVYGGTNIGNILIRESGAGNTQGEMEALEGQTQQSHFTIPAGHRGLIQRVSITVDTGKAVEVKLWKRDRADIIVAPFRGKRLIHEWEGVQGVVGEEFGANHVMEEYTDIWLTAKATSVTATVSVDYDILLIQMKT